MVIPAAASVRWYSHWLRHRLAGADDRQACDAASAELHIDPKSTRRFMLPDPQNPGGYVTLSIPVRKESGLLSDHGNWPHIHLGTLNAIYGRSPYFPYLNDRLQALLGTLFAGDAGNAPRSLAELNRELHRIVSLWIDLEAATAALNAPVAGVCHELATKVNFSVSILDPIFRFGKDIVFVLMDEWLTDDEI